MARNDIVLVVLVSLKTGRIAAARCPHPALRAAFSPLHPASVCVQLCQKFRRRENGKCRLALQRQQIVIAGDERFGATGDG